MWGIESGVFEGEELAAFKAELELAERLSAKMTKAELLRTAPGLPWLKKSRVSELRARAVTLHMETWSRYRKIMNGYVELGRRTLEEK